MCAKTTKMATVAVAQRYVNISLNTRHRDGCATSAHEHKVDDRKADGIQTSQKAMKNKMIKRTYNTQTLHT